MIRLKNMFERLRRQEEKAMGLFLTNGFPEPSATLPLLHALDEAGTDFLELGMPFSDPLAEGLPIQRSSSRALEHGTTLADTLETAAHFRAESETPLLLMGYVNPILQYGTEAFCRDAHRAGVDGIILADLPVEESMGLEAAAQTHELGLVYLIAPNTPDDRIRQIDRRATGFVYAVSVTGLTGSSLDTEPVRSYLHRARRLVKTNPLLVGFGIRSHEDAMVLSEATDGFIVGSKLITTVETLWNDDSLSMEERLAAVRTLAQTLKYGDKLPSKINS
jgi:tryptophan synthase alpha chain